MMGGCVLHLHQCSPRQQRSWASGNKTPLLSSCHTCPGRLSTPATYSRPRNTNVPPACFCWFGNGWRSGYDKNVSKYQSKTRRLLRDAEIAGRISIRGIISSSSESITCILKSDGYLLPQWIWNSPKRSALWNPTSLFYDGWFFMIFHVNRHV